MRHILAITMGDPAGIGPEIAVKAMGGAKIYDHCIPIIIGDLEAMKDAIRFTGSTLEINVIEKPSQARGKAGVIDLIDMGFLKPGSWEYKKVSRLTGLASFRYVEKAISLALDGEADATVTGPINKEAINMAGFDYSGHTEIYADLTGVSDYAMLLASGILRVIHVSTHVSMREACDRVTAQRVHRVISLAKQAMDLIGIENPRIAVAGFNAHCSENGLFGNEESESIIPAIEKARIEGMDVTGPVPPDTVFVKALAGSFDVVVAMYHDQGHIPLKLCGFKMDPATGTYSSVSGINCTIGLPIIRTSVDHGTAFGKAGEGRANEESLMDAIEMAIVIASRKNRA
ncbi:MAG: 4-hydroxythreonine-4-phosphate dehydrogenase PdxA [Oscillospiraceae bacterium]|nr:4-hydroxythreonine-4-phosphate dehydrogenase PdxA [Oscillospiraceae bacterium]